MNLTQAQELAKQRWGHAGFAERHGSWPPFRMGFHESIERADGAHYRRKVTVATGGSVDAMIAAFRVQARPHARGVTKYGTTARTCAVDGCDVTWYGPVSDPNRLCARHRTGV